MPLPEKILNRPELLPGLEFYWVAFNDLCSERSSGMGEGPIPWSSINLYARHHGVDDDEFEVFNSIIRELDNALLEWKAKKRESERK